MAINWQQKLHSGISIELLRRIERQFPPAFDSGLQQSGTKFVADIPRASAKDSALKTSFRDTHSAVLGIAALTSLTK